MTAPASPYQLLGLEPGAGRSAIDGAYRALMKLHHPDRGGDPVMAADINRAYAALTRPEQALAMPLAPTDLAAALYARQQAAKAHRKAGRRMRRRWPVWLAGIALVGGVGWLQREALTNVIWTLQWKFFQPGEAATDGAADKFAPEAPASLDRTPIAPQDLDGALRDARAALGTGGLGRAADVSARCYRQFAAQPSLRGYDRCVAFDNMVLLLAGANAVDRGVFSAASLTARQLAAGRMLDADYDTIETRLDRLRTRTRRKLQPPPLPVLQTPVAPVQEALTVRPG